ncbi:E3 ubiquitin-protein ligase AMFR-like [Arctopsyche grandis]|uniref:E3 ubiquitin-protein ligase AMFR-like n=1 Tax=Arctopsyche grandis TaxID=121162 RepID=UPI00406D8F9A
MPWLGEVVRLPMPSARLYLCASAALVGVSLYQAISGTRDPNWRSAPAAPAAPSTVPTAAPQPAAPAAPRTAATYAADVAAYMVQEPACVWTLINLAYCCLFILGKSIQRVVFGELRVSERQHVKDKFWNFIFYKFIFVFGVINVQFMDEVVLWCAWFSAVGFLQLLAQLCKDRFEYLSFSSSSGGWAGARLGALLSIVLASAIVLLMLCGAVAFYGGGFNTFAFMAAECILLSIRTLHVIFRYGFHVMDARDDPDSSGAAASSPMSVNATPTRDRRTPKAYYTELAFEVAALIIDLLHHLHMLLWSNIFLSMASLVICMQLRYLFHEIQRRVKKHRNYIWVLNHMERTYPMATNEELTANSDNCAICWEKLETARKLPCSHLFHNSCLSSWLQQDTSCPTCRLRLSLWLPSSPTNSVPTHPPPNRHPNHFFHFDGSRYVSWLPSFSVEVTHMMRAELHATNSQMDAMARQVQQLFPHFPLSVILLDLQSTKSMEVTIENILDGRLVPPPRFVSMDNNSNVSGISSALTALHVIPGIPVLPAILLAQNMNSRRPPPSSPDLITRRILQFSLPLVPAQPDHYQTHAIPRNFGTPSSHENEDHVPIRGRFSKCSHERERILRKRKEQLLNSARKKFLDKQAKLKNKSSDNRCGESSSSAQRLFNTAAKDLNT